LKVDTFISIPQHFLGSVVNVLKALLKTNDRWTYADDINLRKVNIMTQMPRNVDDIHRKPSIVVMRGGAAWQVTSINRIMQLQLGQKEKGVELLQGGVRISVIAPSWAEAEDLASFIFSIFMIMRRYLRKGGFLKLESVSLSEVSPLMLQPNTEMHRCSVDINVITALSWTIEEQAPVLEMIVLDVNAKGEIDSSTLKIKIGPE
jgi:hypothetical protein